MKIERAFTVKIENVAKEKSTCKCCFISFFRHKFNKSLEFLREKFEKVHKRNSKSSMLSQKSGFGGF